MVDSSYCQSNILRRAPNQSRMEPLIRWGMGLWIVRDGASRGCSTGLQWALLVRLEGCTVKCTR